MKIKQLLASVTVLFALTNGVKAQTVISWTDLADVSFSTKYFASVDDYFLYPSFGSNISRFKGKEVTITGYFLNLDPNGTIYLLSKYPMANCFFCGGGGPETVLEIRFKEKVRFRTDQVIKVTGTLILNKDDINHCNYILDNASAILAK